MESLTVRRLTSTMSFPTPPTPRSKRPWKIGTALWDRELDFCLAPEFLRVHLAALGESGGGKSKFLELLTRFLLVNGEGGMLVDPANDLADDVLAFVGFRYSIGDEQLLRRCHVLTLGPKLGFRYDPFSTLPSRSAVGRRLYLSRLSAKAKRLLRQLQRRVPLADFDAQNRLKKRLKAVIVGCGVDYDGRGRYLGLDKAIHLANPDSPQFAGLLDTVYPHLPDAQQIAFREVLDEKRRRSAADKWESSQNRLDEVLSPLVELCVSPGPSIDFKTVIANREFVIARMGETPDWDYDQAVTVGGLLIDGFLEVKEAEENVPPHLRVPSTLIVDEVGDFIADDLCRALRNDRKFLLRVILGAQNLATLMRGEVDMAAYVLSLCQTVVCFAQKLREDKEVMADRLFGGNVRLTKEMAEVQRQRGYTPFQTADFSISGNTTKSWAAGGSRGTSRGRGLAHGDTIAFQKNWGDTESEGETVGSTQSRGASATEGCGTTMGYSPIIVGGMHVGSIPTLSMNTNNSRSVQSGQSDSHGFSRGQAHTEGGGLSRALSRIENHTLAVQSSENWQDGGSDGEGWTLSIKTSMLANPVSYMEWTGRYVEGSVADQEALHRTILHTLGTAEAVVSVCGHPFAFPVRIDQVKEFWSTQEEKWIVTRRAVELIAAQHRYTFSPEALDEPGDAAASPPVPPATAANDDEQDDAESGSDGGPQSGNHNPFNLG